MSRKDDIQNLIEKHSRHLQKLQEQKASFGMYAPPHILIAIEDTESEIENLKAESARLEASTDEPSSEDIVSTTESRLVEQTPPDSKPPESDEVSQTGVGEEPDLRSKERSKQFWVEVPWRVWVVGGVIAILVVISVILLLENSKLSTSDGYITFQSDDRIYRVKAQERAVPEDVGLVLDALSPGRDFWLNISPEGEWLLLKTERFDPGCINWPCLVIMRSNLSEIMTVRADWELVRPESWSVVSSDGKLIAYSDNGLHKLDLWVVSRDSTSSENWSAPKLLTEDSEFDLNIMPAISNDGQKIVFSCGNDDNRLDICEVNTDGMGFHIVVTADQVLGEGTTSPLANPDYAPDGSIVFGAVSSGIWRFLPDTVETVEVTAKTPFGGGNGCVLSDGRIVTRKWFEEGHQIRVTTADGSSYFMIPTDSDVDYLIGCG